MAAYEFDFVAEEFGFTITQMDPKGNEIARPDSEAAERIRVQQINQFLSTGKLVRLGGEKKEKRSVNKREAAERREFERRCHVIAETAIEVMLIKGELQSGVGDSAPRPLEQSL